MDNKKIYCGSSKKIPKGKTRGTADECYQKGQLRWYGIQDVEPNLLIKNKSIKKVNDQRQKLINEMVVLKEIIDTNKTRYSNKKISDAKKAEYYDKWKKAEEKYNKLLPKYKEINDNRKKLLS